MKVFKRLIITILVATGLVMISNAAANAESTTVPGQTGRTGDVTGHYTSVYAYDYAGGWYWDLGDGRVYTSSPGIDAVEDLDQATLTVCDYVVNYRADFGVDPYMDSGWIMNQIRCHGYDGNGHYSYLIVHESDPRYTGDPDWAEWGTWEYHVLVDFKSGNLRRGPGA